MQTQVSSTRKPQPMQPRVASLVAIADAVNTEGWWRGKVNRGMAELIFSKHLRPLGTNFLNLNAGGVFTIVSEGTLPAAIKATVGKKTVWTGRVPPGMAEAIDRLDLRPVGCDRATFNKGGWFEIRQIGAFAVVPAGTFETDTPYDRHTLRSGRYAHLFEKGGCVVRAEERSNYDQTRNFQVLVPFAMPGVRVLLAILVACLACLLPVSTQASEKMQEIVVKPPPVDLVGRQTQVYDLFLACPAWTKAFNDDFLRTAACTAGNALATAPQADWTLYLNWLKMDPSPSTSLAGLTANLKLTTANPLPYKRDKLTEAQKLLYGELLGTVTEWRNILPASESWSDEQLSAFLAELFELGGLTLKKLRHDLWVFKTPEGRRVLALLIAAAG